MKNNYLTSTLFALLCLLLNTTVTTAQVVAIDDVVLINGSYSNALLTSVYANDIIDGNVIGTSPVAISMLNASSPLLYLNGGRVATWGGLVTGTYSMTYKVCKVGSTTECDIATVIINVCNLQKPTAGAITPGTCSTPGSVTFTNMPEGNWTMRKYRGNTLIETYTGSGSSMNFPIVSGNFNWRVENESGCIAQTVYTENEFDAGNISESLAASYQDYNNDGIVSTGDVVNYQLSVNNLLSCPIINVNVFDSDGLVAISNSPIASIAAGATDTSVTGVYAITQQDINNGMVFNWLGISGTTLGGHGVYAKASSGNVPLNISNGFTFVPFFDSNGNGVKEAGEVVYEMGSVKYEINDSGTTHHISGNSELTLYETNVANQYDVSFSSHSPYIITSTEFTDISVNAAGGFTTYYFPLTSIPHNDLKVKITATDSGPMPGFTHTNKLFYINNGSAPISGTVTFVHDSAFSIINISQTGTVAIPNGFTYSFTNLMPFTTKQIIVALQVPPLPEVAIDQPVANTFSVNIPEGDINPGNNSVTMTGVIAGAYDPNDKQETHGSEILFADFGPDDVLTYTVRFENTGTANAINILIQDLLDTALDESSVRLVHASKPVVLDRVGSLLKWKFNGINLPPSIENTPTGKGYVTFEVKPKPGYQIGDMISNTADIYFDFNPPITTNTVGTTFVSVLSAKNVQPLKVGMYPNPAGHAVYITADHTIDHIRVSDITGKQVAYAIVNGTSAVMDMSFIASGLYFVEVHSATEVSVLKLIRK